MIIRLYCGILLTLLAGTSIAMSISQDPEARTVQQAESDAEIAISQGDLRLLGISMRVMTLPGIEQSLYEDVRNRCGIRLLPADDVIRSGEEKDEFRKTSVYTRAYNKVMLPYCLD